MNQDPWHRSLFLKYEPASKEKEWLTFYFLRETPIGDTTQVAYVPLNVIRRLVRIPPETGRDIVLEIRTMQCDGPPEAYSVPSQLTAKFVRAMQEALAVLKRHEPLAQLGYLFLERKIPTGSFHVTCTERTIRPHKPTGQENDD